MDGELITRDELNRLNDSLARNLAVAEENNRILKRMQHIGRIAFVAKVIIWTIVLVLPVFLLPLLAPYFKALSGGNSGTSLFGLPSPAEVQKALQEYNLRK